MTRALLLAACCFVACDEPNGHDTPPPPAVHWTYAPPPTAWPLGAVRARFGRSQAPQLVERDGIAGEPSVGLRSPTLWAVPGDGDARAVVYGFFGPDDDHPAIELVDVDHGRVMWRDEATCKGPIIGVTAQAIACAGETGTHALGIDGKPRWSSPGTFVAMTGDRVVVVGAASEVIVLDANSGGELAHIALPEDVADDAIVASCGAAGHELFASLDGKLARIVDGKLVWAAAIADRKLALAELDACSGDSVVATAGTALVAFSRDKGAVLGRVEGVRGYWPARDGGDRIEIATAAGVASWPRTLTAPPTMLALPALGELLGSRGDRRLVRATPLTAALLDRNGVRAYVPFAEARGALGNDHVVAGGAHTLRRFALPPPLRRALRMWPPTAIAVPAELRDLPAAMPVDDTHAIAAAGQATVAAIAIDREQSNRLYVLGDAGIARVDLATSTAAAFAACAGRPLALAIAHDVIACAAGDDRGVHVRAFDKAGAARWDVELQNVDSLAASGDIVLAFAADRVTVLDARDGRSLGAIASDDGAGVRAAIAGDLLVTAERGRVVARVPRAAMTPAWSLAVDGSVGSLAAIDDHVLVALDDGDAFIVTQAGEVTALPGIGLAWKTAGELVTGETAGEPIPPEHMPAEPPLPPKPKVPVPRDDEHPPPPIATPWVVPPPGPPAWQLALYEPTGAVRARDDYALAAPVELVAATARGPAGSPLVATFAGGHEAIAIETRRGDPLRRIALPAAGVPFATIVDGKPIVGVVLPNPLRVVVF